MGSSLSTLSSGAELLGRVCPGSLQPLGGVEVSPVADDHQQQDRGTGDNPTPEVAQEWLILPHKMEFCVQNSLNPYSGSTSLTC